MNYIRVTGWTKKIECRKHRQNNVLYNRKNLQSKELELTQLMFSSKLFVNESLSHENQQLAFNCRKLKSARKIYSTWFTTTVNIKGTLMHISKFLYMFVFMQKEYPENFAFWILGILELYNRKVCKIFVYKHAETIEYFKN